MHATNFQGVTQFGLDSVAGQMDNEIRKQLDAQGGWESPGAYLAAYLREDPTFPAKVCGQCGDLQPIGQSCQCFDNGGE